MERYRAIFSHLLHQPAAQSSVAGKVFVTKPIDEVERRWGRLFGLLTVKPNDRAALDLLEFIAEAVKRAYYTPAAPPAATASGRLHARFEAALREANHAIAQHLEEDEYADVQLETLEGAVGVALGPVVLLATVGPAAAFVVHARRHQEYVVSEITADRHRVGPPNPLHLFTQSMQGQLGGIDYLFCCTQNVLDYVSMERVKRAVSQQPLPTAARTIRDALAPAREPGTFIGILVGLLPQATSEVAHAPASVAEAAEHDSMRQLSRSQERTEQLLTPKLLPRLWRAASAAGRSLSTAASTLAKPRRTDAPPTSPPPTPVADELPTAAPPPGFAGKALPFLRAVLVIAGVLLQRLWASPPIAALRRLLHQRLRALGHWYRRQPLRQQLFTAGIALAILLLVGNVGWRLLSRGHAQRLAQATQLVAQAQTLVDGANASVIYGDEGAARQALQDAQAAVQQARRLGLRTAQLQSVSEAVESALVALRQAHTVAEPTLINNFTNLDAGADPAPAVVAANGVLVAQNRRNGSLYPLTLDTHVLAAPTAPDAELAAFVHLATGDDGAIAVTQPGSLLRLLLPRLTVEPLAIVFAASAVPVASATYQNRLYVLTPAANQVWRLDRAGDGFTAPAAWVQDDTVRLQTAIDLAVDGDVWVLHADARITKLTLGASVVFTQEAIDPPMQAAAKLKLIDNALYVLDPAGRRVVVWDNTGRFQTQYQLPTLDALKDFVVLKPEKKIYLLSGSAVYGIAMR